MIVSPSIASSDILNVAEEVRFAADVCGQVHLDVEDGVAVSGISFGMKMCRKIKAISKDAYISLHLEVYRPLDYLDELLQIKPDIIFIQTDHLEDRVGTLKAFKEKGLSCGVSLSDRDLNSDNEEIIRMSDQIMILTAYLSDPEQMFRIEMADFAQKIAEKYRKRVWIDGGINYELYEKLKQRCPDIYATVMGRGVYGNKEAFKERYRGTSNV